MRLSQNKLVCVFMVVKEYVTVQLDTNGVLWNRGRGFGFTHTLPVSRLDYINCWLGLHMGFVLYNDNKQPCTLLTRKIQKITRLIL